MIMKEKLIINPQEFPKVLFLGNGINKLSESGLSWKSLLSKLNVNVDKNDLTGIPYAMQPEAVCGGDIEYVQRVIASEIEDCKPHQLLEELLSFPFDAVITTNYTYEIEKILSDKLWSKYQRQNSFTVLSGSHHTSSNTNICNVVHIKNRGTVPVFHIHGERERKKSMILSYYSYASSVYQLNDYSRKMKNYLQDAQNEQKAIECQCWLDYFLLGDVYAVGFGFDLSEFDIWWAIERKARENANHGVLVAYLEAENPDLLPQTVLLTSLKATCKSVNTDNGYVQYYHDIIHDIKGVFQNDAEKQIYKFKQRG